MSQCEGHPAGAFDPLGQTVYCDGTCQPAERVFIPTDDMLDAWARYQRGDEVASYELRELDDQRITFALES